MATTTYGENELAIDENDRKLVERMMYGTGSVKRFTQDSPILPDVWMAYYVKTVTNDPRVDLLLTPMRGSPVGRLAKTIRDRMTEERGGGAADVSYNLATVAAKASFRELIRVILPMTRWWHDHVWKSKTVTYEALSDEELRPALAEAITNPERDARKFGDVNADLLWLLRIVGAIAIRAETGKFVEPDPKKPEEWLPLIDAVAKLVEGMQKQKTPDTLFIWMVTLNRRAALTIYKSSVAVKADAASRLFNIKCDRLNWAVVDSGIDARHRAFQSNPEKVSDDIEDPSRLENTRVKATYDFTVVRDLLNFDAHEKKKPPAFLKKALGDPKLKDRISEALSELRQRLDRGQDVDWAILEPLLRVHHTPDQYRGPEHDHGTHVAGILAANWKGGTSEDGVPVDIKGICPDLGLYDFRVLGADGGGDEFSIIAALQFIRHLNANRDYMVIHGANISLSIRHDVSNYACGRTPVCDECERVVAAGVVVVAAAGNLGYHRIQTERGFTEGYQSISITDPGNADSVITVGATHRYRPQTYGVSFFSSRGPTGDGRIKPDLVAPGEKIYSPLPDDQSGTKDGTSMAAPHVSGAAALLLARYNELIGQPARVKQLLCDSATDLGRERYFQGHGMLDILRALQAV